VTDWQPLDQKYQDALRTHPFLSDVVRAIETADIPFENHSIDGWQARDVMAVQSIIDQETLWLPVVKVRMTAAVEDEFLRRVSTGRWVTVQGVARLYQIDSASQANIIAAGALALASIATGSAWPSDYYWIDTANERQPMGALDTLGFARDVGSYVTALILTRRALKDAIIAAPTAAALTAVDTVSAWPSNP